MKEYTHKLSISDRLTLLEHFLKKLNSKAGFYCDWCGKKGIFQTGKNITGRTGTWCSEKCLKKGCIN